MAFHRADADAFYTAKVFKKVAAAYGVLKYYSFDTYSIPKNKAEEINAVFEDYAKYISREFINKLAAMNDKDVVSTKCFLCGAKTRKKVPWFSNNGRNYYSVMVCPRHGNIKGKIRMKKSEQGGIFVVKTMKHVDQTGADNVFHKKEEQRQRRREKRLK